MVCETAKELRELADDIDMCIAGKRIFNIARPVIRNATDHLRAIARIHEMNEDGHEDDITAPEQSLLL